MEPSAVSMFSNVSTSRHLAWMVGNDNEIKAKPAWGTAQKWKFIIDMRTWWSTRSLSTPPLVSKRQSNTPHVENVQKIMQNLQHAASLLILFNVQSKVASRQPLICQLANEMEWKKPKTKRWLPHCPARACVCIHSPKREKTKVKQTKQCIA